MTDDEMVGIPPGRFLMGSRRFYPEEAPVREVEVAAFSIERGPVTVAQFARFVDASGYKTLAERAPDTEAYPGAHASLLVAGSAVFRPTRGPVILDDPTRWWSYVPGASWRHPWGPRSDNSNRADHPVTHVAYEDVEAYATWADRELPSEAEWEYAARGGLEGAVFAWGNEQMPNGQLMANFWQGTFPWRNTGAKGWRGTTPVGLFPANDYGLLDTTGNVWEWTTDHYDHMGAPVNPGACCAPAPVNRCGSREANSPLNGAAANMPQRVVKGGSHLCAPNYCLRYRPAARQPETVDTSTSHIGFRCIVRER